MEASKWTDNLKHYLEERMMHLEEEHDNAKHDAHVEYGALMRIRELQKLSRHFKIELK